MKTILSVGAQLIAPLLVLLCAIGSAVAEEIDNATCFSCHGDSSSQPFIDPAKFETSIHGKNLCTSCHTDITSIPHDTIVGVRHPFSPLYWQEKWVRNGD